MAATSSVTGDLSRVQLFSSLLPHPPSPSVICAWTRTGVSGWGGWGGLRQEQSFVSQMRFVHSGYIPPPCSWPGNLRWLHCCPAQPRAAATIVSGLATALIESTPYLSPGVVGPWCQHSAPSVILLVTGSFTCTGSQACKALLGPGPSQPDIVPSVGKPQLLGCLCHALCFPALVSTLE